MHAMEIISELMNDIVTGRFADAGKLPSEAKLCERFGVSRMTVRGALDELQRRGLIEKRNGLGSFLTRRAMRQSGVIGLVIPDFHRFEFFIQLQREIERHCRRLNYRVELVTSDETNQAKIVADIRHKVRKLASLRAEGVIFRPYVSSVRSHSNREIVHLLHKAEIPVVLIDADIVRPPERSDFDLVAVDNIAAGRRIAEHLRNCRYRRIAFLMPPKGLADNPNWNNRLFGLAGELTLLGHEGGVSILATAPDNQTQLTGILRRRDRPDAIVCGNDETAISLIRTVHLLGLRIPQDIAVVGFDDSQNAKAVTPALTTISQPVGKIASTAFKALLARIRYPNNDPREIFLPAPLVIRGSTGESPASSRRTASRLRATDRQESRDRDRVRLQSSGLSSRDN